MAKGGAIAIIDDDDSFRVALARVLLARGLDVVQFDSAEAYLTEPPAAPLCLLLDVNLPGILGLELQRRLNDTDKAPPIIVMSGSAEQIVRDDAERTGCEAFLRKPFQPDALLRCLSAIAERESGKSG